MTGDRSGMAAVNPGRSDGGHLFIAWTGGRNLFRGRPCHCATGSHSPAGVGSPFQKSPSSSSCGKATS